MSLDTRKLDYPGGAGAFFADLHVSFARWLRFVSLVPLVHASSRGLTTQELCSYVAGAARQGSSFGVLGVCQDRVKAAVLEMLKDEPYFIISDVAKSELSKRWIYEPSLDQDIARISFAFRISQRCKTSAPISPASLFIELFSAESTQSASSGTSLHTGSPSFLPVPELLALGPPIGLSPPRTNRPAASLSYPVPIASRTVEDDVFTYSGSPPSPRFSSPVLGEEAQDRFASNTSALRPSTVRTPPVSKRSKTRAALLASAAFTPTPSSSRKRTSAAYSTGRSTTLIAKSVNLPSPSKTIDPCNSTHASGSVRSIFKNFTPSPRRNVPTRAMIREPTPLVAGASHSISERDLDQLSVSRVSTEAPLPLFLSSSSSNRGSSPPSSVGSSPPCDPRHSLKTRWASLQDSQKELVIPSESSAERAIVMLMRASSPRCSPRDRPSVVTGTSSHERMKGKDKTLPATRPLDEAGFGSATLSSKPTAGGDVMSASADLTSSILTPISSPEVSSDKRRQKGRFKSKGKGKENLSVEATSSDEPIADFALKPQVCAHAPSPSPSLNSVVVRSRGTSKTKKAILAPQSRKRRVVLSSSSSSSCNSSGSSASDDGGIDGNSKYTTRPAKGKKPPAKKARRSPSPHPTSGKPSSSTRCAALILVAATKPTSTSSKSSTTSHPPMTVLSSSEAKRKLAAVTRVARPKAEEPSPSAGPARSTCIQRQPTLPNAVQGNPAPAKCTSTIPARVPSVRVYQVIRSVNPASKEEKLRKEIVHESYGQDVPKKAKAKPTKAAPGDPTGSAPPLRKTASVSAHANTKRMSFAESAKLAQKHAQVQEKKDKAGTVRAKSRRAKAADDAPMEADEPVVLPPREEPKELEDGHWAFDAVGDALKPKPDTPVERECMLTGQVVKK